MYLASLTPLNSALFSTLLRLHNTVEVHVPQRQNIFTKACVARVVQNI